MPAVCSASFSRGTKGAAMMTALARLGGRNVAIVANDLSHGGPAR